DKHVENARKDIDARFKDKGLGADALTLLKSAVKAPLAGFFDGYDVYFVGADAKVVAQVLDLPAADPLEIDGREWNGALVKLQAAGHEIAMSSVPADAE